jgi:hypothetical protein
MFLYCWWETDKPNECKFGERFVLPGQDPKKEVWKRIRASLGVRKDIIDDGLVKLEAYWDVSDWAEKVGRNKKQKRMDDYVREMVGFRKGTTGEIHTLSAVELVCKVNELLQKHDQPLPVAGLSQWQFDTAVETVEAIEDGNQVIMAELCARFGKTIWAGALALETEAPLTIVASYVLTSFFSFKKDLTSFEQFRDLVVIDSANDNYLADVKAALKDGKQVVVFLSMCGTGKRDERIKKLFGIRTRRLLIVDEADFGAHTKNQTEPFIAAVKKNDNVVLMTGTNGERACGDWTIDYYLGMTYAELLVAKAEAA